nr:hypothetical protein [Rhodococcus rhodochrous]
MRKDLECEVVVDGIEHVARTVDVRVRAVGSFVGQHHRNPGFGEWHVIAVERMQAGLHRQRRVGRGRASEFVDQVLRQARAFEKDGGRRGIE